ncbi:hypothetical protein MNBD_GAMMA19-559 [hydrothermal vent metagenome]|uniref:Uncharacterized protein n=1 Tax=hydrothermal vent metagenome TaxID=652676 RepID=A0A3B0ZN62_9ZZZZ
MKLIITGIITIILISMTSHSFSDDEVELETTFIKGNKELPQVLYIVPWKEVKKEKGKKKILVLHSLFGDAFDPVTPKNLGQ